MNMRCIDCGTSKDVRKVKHLPLPNGKAGHITLAKWTVYCPVCILLASNKYDGVFEAAAALLKERGSK